MMQLTAAMVGMLGGPALQVLVVLSIEREWRSLGFLQDMANLSEKTVHQAVRKLRTLGYIDEQTLDREKCYRLVGNAVQLPFGAPLLSEPVEADPLQGSHTSRGQTAGADPLQGAETAAVENSDDDSRKFYGRRPLNESMNQGLIEINENDSLIDDDIAVNSGDAQNDPPVSENDLKAFGFYGWGLKDLLGIPELTFAEVKHQVQDAPSLGAALVRLRKRQPWARPVDQDVGEERKKYISGEFAGFIQH